MVVEKMKIGNTKVTIHDDCIVSDEKVDVMLQQLGAITYNQMKKEGDKNVNIKINEPK